MGAGIVADVAATATVIVAVVLSVGHIGARRPAPESSGLAGLHQQERALRSQIVAMDATLAALAAQAATAPGELTGLDRSITSLLTRSQTAEAAGNLSQAKVLQADVATMRAQHRALTAMIVAGERQRDALSARLTALRAQLADVQAAIRRLQAQPSASSARS
jgi:chromosome segregation ATPase